MVISELRLDTVRDNIKLLCQYKSEVYQMIIRRLLFLICLAGAASANILTINTSAPLQSPDDTLDVTGTLFFMDSLRGFQMDLVIPDSNLALAGAVSQLDGFFAEQINPGRMHMVYAGMSGYGPGDLVDSELFTLKCIFTDDTTDYAGRIVVENALISSPEHQPVSHTVLPAS